MPEFFVEFEVYCSCGAGLCQQSTGSNDRKHGGAMVTVEPCERCVQKARDEAGGEGYDRGYKDGENDFKSE